MDGDSRFVNISVHMTPMVRQENMMAETSLQFVERTGRVASAPRNATASQPKGPTNATTRMGMGHESPKFDKEGAALKVMKKRPLPPIKYAANANQNEVLSCVIRFMRLEISTPVAGEGCRACELANVLWRPPLPFPSTRPSRCCQTRRGEKFPGDALPRVALVPHLPWATIISSLRDFSLVAQRKLRAL